MPVMSGCCLKEMIMIISKFLNQNIDLISKLSMQEAVLEKIA